MACRLIQPRSTMRSANNVVPDLAVLRFNIRPREAAMADLFAAELAALIARIEAEHDVSVHTHGGISRPPKVLDARAEKTVRNRRGMQRAAWRANHSDCFGRGCAMATT